MEYEGGMGGVDGWGIDREAAQLSRDPLKGNDDWIRSRWRRKQLIRLDIEGGQYCGKQPPLYITRDGQYSQQYDQHWDVRRLEAYQSLHSSV